MILVTGATGFVGRHTVAALVARGTTLRLLSRRFAATDPAARALETVQGDLDDAEAVARSLAGVHTVLHLAGALGRPGTSPEELTRVNVEGTRRIARAARSAGAARVIHLSSAAVYGEDLGPYGEDHPLAPASAYGASKLAAERVLAEELEGSSVASVVLRPTGVYGPGSSETTAFYRQVRRRRLWLYGRAPVIVHPTHVSDVVQGILSVLVLDRTLPSGSVFNLGGERALSHRDLVRMVAARLGVKTLTIGLPVRRQLDRSVDTRRAREALGFRPRSLEDGIDETVTWARAEGIV